MKGLRKVEMPTDLRRLCHPGDSKKRPKSEPDVFNLSQEPPLRVT